MSALPPQVQEVLAGLASCTPEQLAAIASTIQSVQAQNPEMPHTASKQRKKRTSSTSGKRALKSAGASPEDVRAKRPLNSYMAFRSYYSSMFVKFQQKEISGFLKGIWDAEPFKGKWYVLWCH